jgi:hypothetical protein
VSYCRWSSNDHQCDVYVYQSVDGFVTNVARTRYAPTEAMPEPISFTPDDVLGWAERNIERSQQVWAVLDAAPTVLIGLAHDGETFVHATASECADHLAHLAELGYRVPADVITDLREEDEQEEAQP